VLNSGGGLEKHSRRNLRASRLPIELSLSIVVANFAQRRPWLLL
jgi:hypothetical protein